MASVLNTTADISGRTLLTAQGSYTVTGLLTFDRDPSAPFAVSASSAVVPNLDADKIDGYHATEIGILAEDDTVAGAWAFSGIANTGLKVLDTDASHALAIVPGSNLTSARTLTLTTGDASRTITLSGNPTLSDWFDQSVKTTASVAFAGLTVTNTSTPQALVAYDGSNYCSISVSNAGAVTFNAVGSSSAFIFSDAVTVSGNEVYRSADDDYVRLSGGDAGGTGANVLMFGSTHASNANKMFLTGTAAITMQGAVTTITASTGTTITTPAITTTGKLTMATSRAATYGAGDWGYNSTYGSYIMPKAGSVADFSLYNNDGYNALVVDNSSDMFLYSRNTVALTLGASQAATFAGTVDAPSYKVGGASGVSFSGAVTNITVVNGIVTAVS